MLERAGEGGGSKFVLMRSFHHLATWRNKLNINCYSYCLMMVKTCNILYCCSRDFLKYLFLSSVIPLITEEILPYIGTSVLVSHIICGCHIILLVVLCHYYSTEYNQWLLDYFCSNNMHSVVNGDDARSNQLTLGFQKASQEAKSQSPTYTLFSLWWQRAGNASRKRDPNHERLFAQLERPSVM